MTDEGYATKSIRSTIRIISAFIEWKNDRSNGDPAQLVYDDIESFHLWVSSLGACSATASVAPSTVCGQNLKRRELYASRQRRDDPRGVTP